MNNVFTIFQLYLFTVIISNVVVNARCERGVVVLSTQCLLCSHDGLHSALLWTELTVPGVSRWWLVVVVAVVSSLLSPLSHRSTVGPPPGRKEGNPGSRPAGAETSVTTSGDCHARTENISDISIFSSRANNTQYRPGAVGLKVCAVLWILHYIALSNKQ